MKMNDPLRKAGHLFLALLLVTMALPARGEETSQSANPAPSSEETSKPAKGQAATTAAPEQAEPKATPEPAATKAAPTSAAGTQIITPPESTTPPRGLKLVGNHWTPYQPPDPESFPEGAQVHIIVNGNTLWGMADTHFQNPWLWPQIWNENRYILDSHWIYPGDPLLLPPRPTVVSEIVPADGQTGYPSEPEEAAPEPMDQSGEGSTPQASAPSESEDEGPSPVADYSDLYCTGTVRPDYQKTELYIANSEDVKIGLTTGDLVYLNGGRDGGKVSHGDSFLIIAKGSEVFHPVTGKWVGTYVRRLGRVKVLAVQDQTSIAEITESCQDRIEVGFELEADRT
ncbi:MAG: LysM peptidoglycan-binding domain-containing protein, partial [Acidobacteria bacterium]|nr:LysM peptidoglycan-binding domain-containing protein [Acidobacteriota bacterium]